MIAPTTSIGARPHAVTVTGPTGAPVPDADGNPTQGYGPLPPTWYVSISPATQRELERLLSGTTTTVASHIVRGPYRADVTTATQLLFNGRTFYVNAVQNPDEADRDTIAICQELVS